MSDEQLSVYMGVLMGSIGIDEKNNSIGYYNYKKEDNSKYLVKLISDRIPAEIISYHNPLSGEDTYKITFKKQNGTTETFEKNTWTGIINEVKHSGIFFYPNETSPIMCAIRKIFEDNNLIHYKVEVDAPGFFLRGKTLFPNKMDDKWTPDELQGALTTLGKIHESFSSTKNMEKIFATIVKWGSISPFIYVWKLQNKMIPYAYLFGQPHSGKTTLAKVVISMWCEQLQGCNILEGTGIDTIARLGEKVSQSTLPIVVNEPKEAFRELGEAIKSIISSPVARGKFVEGKYTNILSLNPIIFTSNHPLDLDGALMRRFIWLEVLPQDAVSAEQAKKFDDEMLPLFPNLRAIGKFVTAYIITHQKELEKDWKDLSAILLNEMYSAVNMKLPSWSGLWELKDSIGEAKERMMWKIRESMKSYIERTYSTKHMGELAGVSALSEMAVWCAYNHHIPWLTRKSNGDIVIQAGVSEALHSYQFDDVISLPQFAGLFGWDSPKSVTINGKTVHGIVLTEAQFKEFLEPVPQDAVVSPL